MVKSENMTRMTDANLYTGLHKERFDEEGKGRGLEGRDYVPKGAGYVPAMVSDQQGYVSGYKNEGTYNTDIKPPAKSDQVWVWCVSWVIWW